MKKTLITVLAIFMVIGLMSVPASAEVADNPMTWTWGAGGILHVETMYPLPDGYRMVAILFQGKETWQGRDIYPNPNTLVEGTRICPTQWEFLLPHQEVVMENQYELNIWHSNPYEVNQMYSLSNGNKMTPEAERYTWQNGLWGNVDQIAVYSPLAKTAGVEGGRILLLTEFWSNTSYMFRDW